LFPKVEFKFPEIIDKDDDAAKIVINEDVYDKEWINFDIEANTIIFDPNKVPKKVLREDKNTEIPFKLVDERGAFSTHKLIVEAK
jgi:cobalamin-dependent methionine synthase I